MFLLELKNIYKQYNKNTFIINDINLSINEGEFISILGTSGSGKSTLLKIIGGHESVSEGKIILNNKDITKLEANKRPIHTIFQDLGLFPHMSVEENISFPLIIKKVNKREIKVAVEELSKNFNIQNKLKNKIHELSGGEQQRVAIARSIISKPKLLLCDEPLSKLDKNLKEELLNFLLNFFLENKISTIYVTHDYKEAFSLSNKIYILNNGKFVQFGKPEEIIKKPINSFVAKFLGIYNIFTNNDENNKLFNVKSIKKEFKFFGISIYSFSLEKSEKNTEELKIKLLSKIIENDLLEIKALLNMNIIHIKLKNNLNLNISKGDIFSIYYNIDSIIYFYD